MLKIKKKNYFMKLIEVKNNILLGLDKFAKENQFKIVKKDFAIKKRRTCYAREARKSRL